MLERGRAPWVNDVRVRDRAGSRSRPGAAAVPARRAPRPNNRELRRKGGLACLQVQRLFHPLRLRPKHPDTRGRRPGSLLHLGSHPGDERGADAELPGSRKPPAPSPRGPLRAGALRRGARPPGVDRRLLLGNPALYRRRVDSRGPVRRPPPRAVRVRGRGRRGPIGTRPFRGLCELRPRGAQRWVLPGGRGVRAVRGVVRGGVPPGVCGRDAGGVRASRGQRVEHHCEAARRGGDAVLHARRHALPRDRAEPV
mmetsp:Transcript_23555/g.56228  ORF Transcript_23555/g.56228 Transcript_23555/m.56228 type:complete len:254 (+) Transcript_23555:571-1332(+)